MSDILTPLERSKRMRAVRQRGTAPEVTVRKIVQSLGVRCALNSRSLPGAPDLVFRQLRKVVFVHGCFWHGHSCPQGRQPSSHRGYWIPKLEENRRRDRRNRDLLKKADWKSLVVWQCQMKSRASLINRLSRFLEVGAAHGESRRHLLK
jgi:DNA mismatch endonuclease, patch repair protein